MIGVPNDDFGEEVKAVVQLADGHRGRPRARARAASPTAASAWPTSSAPASIDFEDELPRLPTGKLYKRLLKDRYWVGHQSRII